MTSSAMAEVRRPSRGLMAALVELTLTTAYIHFTLGGLLFTLNAAGYAALAAAMLVAVVVPHPVIRRFDWLPRVGLAGYTATTIVGYLVMGPYFSLGWVAKAIEVAILTLLAADIHRTYGSLAGLVRAAAGSLGVRAGRGPLSVA